MKSRFLTVDLGNSRCKLCVWSADADARSAIVEDESACATTGELAAHVTRWLESRSDIEGAAVSSVASAVVEEALVSVLRAALRDRVHVGPACGLDIDVREPDRVGKDRLYAARGAWEHVRSSAVVVDAGTALTVDALTVRDARPCFAGGAIAPGPRLLADALADHTARLPRIDPHVGAAALGRDTHAALQAGVVVGFRGAARELAARVALEAGLSDHAIVVTGGAAPYLLEPPVYTDRTVVIDAHLVQRGLLAALLDRVPRS